MKILYKILTILVLSFGFNGCGEEGSDSSFTSSDNTTIVSCDSTTDIPDGYTTLDSGDTIVKETDGTIISVYHSSDGTKKICVSSGLAYIVKG